VACLAGSLGTAGFDDIRCIATVTNHISADDQSGIAPDVVGCTAISPAIYAAESVLSAHLLARASACHAWTFAHDGLFPVGV
jgi:hypothetical protein